MGAKKRALLMGLSRDQLRIKHPWKYSELDEDGISLSLAEIDFSMPEPVKKAIIEAVLNDEYHYSLPEGLPEFLQAVVDRWKRFNHVDIEMENVLPTVGAMNGIWLTSKVCLNPGDEAVIVTPIYGPILKHMFSAGVKVIVCPARNEDYHLNLEEIERRISGKTRLIVICNPNNPTGAVYTRSELEGLADIARRKKIYVFSDELYDTLTYDGRRHVSIASLPDMKDLTITVNGFTKTYGMSGLRIGYVVASKEVIKKMRELNAEIVIHPSTIAQKAAAAAYNYCDEWMECLRAHCEKMRNMLCAALSKFESISCPKPEGAFFAFPDVSKLFRNDVDAALWLKKTYKVKTTPGSEFGKGGEGHLRLNFATTEEILREAIERLSRAIAEAERNLHFPQAS